MTPNLSGLFSSLPQWYVTLAGWVGVLLAGLSMSIVFWGLVRLGIFGPLRDVVRAVRVRLGSR